MGGIALCRRSPAFARLLGAQTISPLGDAMATTALILHLQETTGTATSVALLLFAQAVPPLSAPWSGAIADRMRPVTLLTSGFVVQGVLAAALAVELPPLGLLLAMVFLLALVDTPLDAAIGRTLPATVDDDDLPSANALRGGARELGTVLGPPLAGLLFAVSGPGLVLAVDALTYLAAIPLILRLPVPSGGEEEDGAVAGAGQVGFGRAARDGLAFVWRTTSVRAMALGYWIVVFFSASDDLILPFLASVTFDAGPLAVGFLLAAASVGLLIGLPLVRPTERRLGVGTAVVVAFTVTATGNLMTAAAPWLAAAFAAQVVRGVAIPVADSLVVTHLQRTAPARVLGRVLANVYGGVGVAAALGYLVGGPLLDATSPRVAFLVVGLGGLVGAAVTARLLRRAASNP